MINIKYNRVHFWIICKNWEYDKLDVITLILRMSFQVRHYCFHFSNKVTDSEKSDTLFKVIIHLDKGRILNLICLEFQTSSSMMTHKFAIRKFFSIQTPALVSVGNIFILCRLPLSLPTNNDNFPERDHSTPCTSQRIFRNIILLSPKGYSPYVAGDGPIVISLTVSTGSFWISSLPLWLLPARAVFHQESFLKTCQSV